MIWHTLLKKEKKLKKLTNLSKEFVIDTSSQSTSSMNEAQLKQEQLLEDEIAGMDFHFRKMLKASIVKGSLLDPGIKLSLLRKLNGNTGTGEFNSAKNT